MNKLWLKTEDGVKMVEGDFDNQDLKTINDINSCNFDVEFDKDDFTYAEQIDIIRQCNSNIDNKDSFIPPEVDEDLLAQMRKEGLL